MGAENAEIRQNLKIDLFPQITGLPDITYFRQGSRDSFDVQPTHGASSFGYVKD
jgi:hypothetical protein